MPAEEVLFRGTTEVPANCVWELELEATEDKEARWPNFDLAVEFRRPDGEIRTVPAFWAGGRRWRVRYSSALEGTHTFRSTSSGSQLLEMRGEVVVTPYAGNNPLLRHGAPRIAADGRHLTYADGTPFFWLADTWWSAFTGRFRWPDTFQTLADDRAEKGFTVVQTVAGLVPEFAPFSAETANEGGQPWTDGGHGEINPAFFDVPDKKIDYLVASAIVPCIVGGWAFYSHILGRQKVMEHWRYLVARYGAYPVVWCIAGEVNLAGIWEALAEGRAPNTTTDEAAHGMSNSSARDAQIEIWEGASELVDQIDAFDRVRTVHPLGSSSSAFRSRNSFDLDMLQTGHTGWHSVPQTMERLRESLAYGDKPVFIGECSYEGIFDSCWHDVQRFFFWTCMLSGAAGHTYGTMAISSFNSRTDPHLPLSHVSMHYWEDAISWLGSAHVSTGKRVLERYPYWELQPSPGRIAPHASPDDWYLNYAAELDDGTLIIYQPSTTLTNDGSWHKFASLTVRSLRPGEPYRVTYIDPRSGIESQGERFSSEDGEYEITARHIWHTPTGEDWVIVIAPA